MPTYIIPSPPGTPLSRVLPNLLGRGTTFPIQSSETGGLHQSEGDQLVGESVDEILGTDIGEGVRAFDVRDGQPYGTRIRRYLFESVEQVRDPIVYEVRRVLEVWEPRIIVRRVEVDAPEDVTSAMGRRTIRIRMNYMIRATNRSDNRVVLMSMRTA